MIIFFTKTYDVSYNLFSYLYKKAVFLGQLIPDDVFLLELILFSSMIINHLLLKKMLTNNLKLHQQGLYPQGHSKNQKLGRYSRTMSLNDIPEDLTIFGIGGWYM